MKKPKLILCITILLILIIISISCLSTGIETNVSSVAIILAPIILFTIIVLQKPKKNNTNKQEPEKDLISVKKLEEEYKKELLKLKINELKEYRKGYVYKCKYCNCTYDNEIKFCPSCGAKIEKTTKEE